MSLSQSPFGIVPVEVAMDHRLTLQQMRVLLALYTFRNKNTELAHPTREEIQERTGMAVSKISKATSDLERLGWLTKAGNGGRSRATRYRVHVPETVPDSVTVTESVTVTDQARNGARIGIETVPDSGRGIEQTIHTRTNKSSNALAEFGVSDELLADFIEVRKAKRAGKLTSTAIAGIEREAKKVGLTVEQAVVACCEFGWQGFNAGWYIARTQDKKTAPAASETVYQRSMRERMQEAVPSIAKKAPSASTNVIDFFEVEAKKLEDGHGPAIALG